MPNLFTELAGAVFGPLVRLFQRPAAGDWSTSGPPLDEHPPVHLTDVINAANGNAKSDPGLWSPGDGFVGGWWRGARKTPALERRLGHPIVPWGLVVHTTDTMPGGFDAIVKSWTQTVGAGNAAHFMIGRTPKDGVVQFAPITINANHAGGPVHGNFKTKDGALVHPNLRTVGVELDNGGRLIRRGNMDIVHPDTGKQVPIADVFWDPYGHPWHAVTPYQMDQLQKLWLDLRACLIPVPEGTTVAPDATYESQGVKWAQWWRPDLVGHVTLDPINKTDPGPQVLQIIRGW